MKLFHILLGLLFIGVTTSCSQQFDDSSDIIEGGLPTQTIGLTEPELLSIMYDSENDLSASEVDSIISDFITENKKTKDADNFKLVSKENVVSSSTRSRQSAPDHVTFYDYEIFSEGNTSGKAIVCGDKRFPSVLAYIDSYESDNEAANIMIDNAKSQALKSISSIKHYEDSLRNSTIDKIRTKTKIKGDFKYKDIESSIYLITTNTRGWAITPGGTQRAIIGPLTSTQWNQDSPYNLYAPSTVDTDNYFGAEYANRYPAGCVVVAMAQIAAWCKPNMTGINWNIASVNKVSNPDSESAIQIAKVISMIAKGSGTTYGPNGGSTSAEKAINYMKTLGISIDGAKDCNFQNVKPSLDALRLVLVTGTARKIITRGFNADGNHAWIIDGYQIRERSNARTILKQYNTYCHCNFGWGGSSDGWYLFNSDGSISFSCNGFEWIEYQIYDYNLKAYPNVRIN